MKKLYLCTICLAIATSPLPSIAAQSSQPPSPAQTDQAPPATTTSPADTPASPQTVPSDFKDPTAPTGAAPLPTGAAPAGTKPAAPKSEKEIEREQKEAEKKKLVPLIGKDGRMLLNPDGSPMMAPADTVKHGLFSKKEKLPKMTPVDISRGTFTVDGVIAKAGMNYDIADLKYIYMSAPGIGTVVISDVFFPGAKAQRDAFNGQTLTVKVGDHTMELFSDKRLLNSKKPEDAWIVIDPSYTYPAPSPTLGYGNTNKAPYFWPGSHENAAFKRTVAPPPPIPTALRPKMLPKPCPVVIKTAPPAPGTAAAPAAAPCVNPPAPAAAAKAPEPAPSSN